jgi:hypothetical protein
MSRGHCSSRRCRCVFRTSCRRACERVVAIDQPPVCTPSVVNRAIRLPLQSCRVVVWHRDGNSGPCSFTRRRKGVFQLHRKLSHLRRDTKRDDGEFESDLDVTHRHKRKKRRNEYHISAKPSQFSQFEQQADECMHSSRYTTTRQGLSTSRCYGEEKEKRVGEEEEQRTRR